jgi:hypothetical protein
VGAASLPAVLYQRVPNEEQDIRPHAFWPRRMKLFSPAHLNDSYSSSHAFTRPPSLAPRPLIAGRLRNRVSRIDSAACAGLHCPGALDGSSRIPPQPVGSLMAEHQVRSVRSLEQPL